jgi:hypothetical protein
MEPGSPEFQEHLRVRARDLADQFPGIELTDEQLDKAALDADQIMQEHNTGSALILVNLLYQCIMRVQERLAQQLQET